MTLGQTFSLIAADTRERARIEKKRYGFLSYLKLLLNPPALAVVSYRISHFFQINGWSLVAEVIRRATIVLLSSDISPKAVIGHHFMLFHANGIAIGDRVQIGANVYLVHHNTIDVGPRPDERPDDRVVIEDNVILGCGVRVLGNVSIGRESFVGAGAVVTESLPECSFHLSGPGETNHLL